MAKTKWALDLAHSNIDFSIKHMMFARVNGSFKKFDANIEADPEDLTTATIEFTVDASSIDTRNEDRDNHLRSADFFDVEKYPAITFKATKITRKSPGEYEVTGDLTIRDVTRQETFIVTYEGSGKDPWGNERAGFSARGTISRSEYGLKWNAVLETGGVLVGDDVQISVVIQAIKQA
ncbi:polyisoprenoid-binding protein [Alicyclobacillus cellulosilyticus]|uniref:Polyisoprenoid-binding protein n=1 Tax=Alicyclobacillus cellulosilyticus TaxID=1003997 RepID=A0A917KDA4_9BACL|nr:YceI family protein [Alicyclobacillus cellulosilyticus]GGJ09188.1 polyisoprenoid-binding protein [Alicyclobacillus cellulosilyticus]